MKQLLVGIVVGAVSTAAIFEVLRRVPAADRDITVSAPEEADISGPGSAARAPTSPVEPPQNAHPAGSTRTAPSPARSSAQASAAAPARGSSVLDIPNGELGDAASTKAPLDKLLEAFRVRCQFGPGAGGNWPKGRLFPHAAAWQGGPVTFDNVDLAASTARMQNPSGFLRTPDGELDVRVHATDTGLHFTVFTPGGELLVTTVYAELDADGRHRAAISMHGTGLDHETAQFYGGCTP